jgi:hypothetical protein
MFKKRPEDEGLLAFRGLQFGVPFSIPIWVGIVLLIIWLLQ